MRPPATAHTKQLAVPVLISQAREVATVTKNLSISDIQNVMSVSEKLAATTKELISTWNEEPTQQRVAIDSFLGDIYSGLQVHNWSDEDRSYANQHVRILSGLYGILKPLDGIYPYRLEMGYRLSIKNAKNLYDFWGTSIVETLPPLETFVDLSAVEYGKTVTKYIDPKSVISPRFLTISQKTGEPTFVVLHAKIARGAFASWVVRNKIDDPNKLKEFNEIGYSYDETFSTPQVPVFICKTFGGLGLSVRLS